MWSSRLLDVWLKLDWAKRHAEALKADMKRWCDVQSRQTTMVSLTQRLYPMKIESSSRLALSWSPPAGC